MPTSDPTPPTEPSARPVAGEPVLVVDGLTVRSGTGHDHVHEASFTLRRGTTLGIVGESGSGKSLTCRAVLGLLPPGLTIAEGSIRLDGVELTGLTSRDYQALRRARFGAVFQDPGSYLNPSARIGTQLAESLFVHGKGRGRSARRQAVDLLDAVGMEAPDAVARQFPFELSGGMLQRVLLALALSGDPDILIADEATTALDAIVQHQIVELIESHRRARGLTMIMVSHDLALVSRTCDDLVVMREGRVVEKGPRAAILRDPQHAYTRMLIDNHVKYGLDARLATVP